MLDYLEIAHSCAIFLFYLGGEISNHNFFSVYFLHVWGVKTAIFYELFSKTDLGEQRGFGGAIGKIDLLQK